MVAPGFKKHLVVGKSDDGLGLSVVLETMGSCMPAPFVVKFEDVRIVQEFVCKDNCSTSIVLLPDSSKVNTL